MTELKPCPFCNGAAKVKTRQYHDDPEFHRISVECDECSAEHPVHHRVKTQQVEKCQTDVATVWNERKGQFFLLNPHGHPIPNEERPFMDKQMNDFHKEIVADAMAYVQRKNPELRGQSKTASAIEAVVNVVVGYGVAVAAQALIFPLFNIHVSTGEHLVIGGLFTVVSLVRSYTLRRIFNYWSN